MSRVVRWFAAVSIMSLALIMIGCGSTGSTGASTQVPPPPTPGTANLSVFMKDAAADNVLAFKVDVTSVAVTDANGHSTTLSTTPMSFEMRHLEMAPTLALEAGSLPSGGYSTLNLTLANPSLIVNSGGTPTAATPQMASTSLAIPLSSFSLPSGGTQGLILDFDLQASISQNASGTYVITPVVHESAVAPGSSGMQLVDTVGKIAALPGSPANSFDFQANNAATTARIVTDTNTVFDASIGSFSSLQVGQYVEVEGQLQNDGTFLAKYVELSDSNPLLRVGGVVAAVQKDATGNLTSINLVVQD